jgi:hypothetical protein
MKTVDIIFGIFFFVVYNTLIFGFGYNVGFNDAIDKMKKVKSRK